MISYFCLLTYNYHYKSNYNIVKLKSHIDFL